MPTYGQFRVQMSCEGQRMQEYAVDSSADRKVVDTWVASDIGKAFSVHVTNFTSQTALPYDYSIRVYVDGILADSFSIPPVRPPEKPTTVTIRGARIDSRTIKPFLFSAVRLTGTVPVLAAMNDSNVCSTDRDSLPRPPSIYLDSIGSVVVTISRVTVKSIDRCGPPPRKVFLDDSAIPERKKKFVGVTHRVRLGDRLKEEEATHSCFVVPFDPENPGPFLTFEFKYRPYAYLQAQGFAPPPLDFSHVLHNKKGAQPAAVCRHNKRAQTPKQCKTPTSSFRKVLPNEDLAAEEIGKLKANLISMAQTIRNLEDSIHRDVPRMKKERSMKLLNANWNRTLFDLTNG
ncbi:hypothetical protein BD410DRAFT_902355 [Rickenella mellea]|uniref:DUF7918 domain-containing protein n=1 Tax=Rickenella mellea TaxID=50990 RepID=A0A4Y7PL40_9AGAM|nr:hypothetical protein BD410DRAFT_902355 [Rickenella mellea]